MSDGAIKTFYIKSDNPKITFTANFGSGSAMVVDGYGGWEVKSRPKEIGIVEWVGRNPMAIEIPFQLDNFTDYTDMPGVETEQMVRRLERLCGLGSHGEPPICKVNGEGAIPHDEHDFAGHWWVIENVAWDRETEIRNEGGNRIRCGGMITIRQYIDASDIMKRLGPNARAIRPEIYIVKKGDTLSKIAAKKNIYGNANLWKRIADANNIRDPRNLTVGQKLRIPRVGSQPSKKK